MQRREDEIRDLAYAISIDKRLPYTLSVKPEIYYGGENIPGCVIVFNNFLNAYVEMSSRYSNYYRAWVKDYSSGTEVGKSGDKQDIIDFVVEEFNYRRIK